MAAQQGCDRIARQYGAAACPWRRSTPQQRCDCPTSNHGSHSRCSSVTAIAVLYVRMATTARGAIARRSTPTALPAAALPLHRHCCVHVAVPMVSRDHSARQYAVTAPRMSDCWCIPLRRVSALTPAHPRRVVLCACGCVCIVPAVHSRCLTHSLPHPSLPHSTAGSACAWKHSSCRRRHRSLPPISLLATRSASRRRMLRALSAMHSSAQLLVFMHTKWQCQCSIFYLMRER